MAPKAAVTNGRPNSDPGAPKSHPDPSRRAMPNDRPDPLPSLRFATHGGANDKPSLDRGAPNGRRDPKRQPSATGRQDLVATIHIATPAQNRQD